LAKYDPNQDIPYGVAGADFPLTFYDRPQYMFANLLRGNIDAATRAMLSPDTLTPDQIKTVRDVLLPGKKPNKLMKTICDIATNPLVIMGLVVGLWKYPMGTLRPLQMVRDGLLPKSAAMGKMMSGLHGAMDILRTVPGMFKSLLGVTRETAKFIGEHGDKANEIFLKAGPLSKAEGIAVAARLDGLHAVDHSMVKLFRNEPEWIAFMGGKDVPIAPNLQNKMSKKLIGLSDRLRGWFDKTRSVISTNPEAEARIIREVEHQGLDYGKYREHYFPRNTQYDKYYNQSIKGTTGVQYRKWLYKKTKEKIGREQIARTGLSMSDLNNIRSLESNGMVKSGFSDMTQSILNRWSDEASSTVREIWNDVGKLGLNEAQERVEFIKRVSNYYTKGAGKNLNFLGRLGSPKRAKDTLDAMAGALQDARFGGAEAIGKEFTEIGRVLAQPATYSLDPWNAAGKYLSSIANSYAWHGTGLGQRIMGITETPGVFRGAPYIESYLMDNLIPHVRGLKSYQELHHSLSFGVPKQKIYEWIKASPFVESTLGDKTKKWLLDYFGQAGNSLSAEGMSAKISEGFYLSTLGANISPASKNLLQNWITTINLPGIGIRGMYRGLMGVADQEGALVKMKRYLGMLTSGVDSKTAYAKAFPEYVKDAGDASHIVESLLAGDMAREGYTKLIRAGGAWEKIKRGLLMPFSTSEAFNRITGYYAGRNSHLFHNLGKYANASPQAKAALLAEAGEMGQAVTMYSHFSGGPLAVPRLIMNLPSPLRQFMMFPLRYAGFLHGSLRLGPDPSKLDWGTIGRTLAGSTATYIAAKNLLGLNLEPALMTGALPVSAYERAPFYPFPLVPPALGVIGGVAKSLLTGSAEGLAGPTAAMLVPGGLAARRMYRSFSPKFADYRNKTSDGRIPLYNDDHALIGTLSPMQMVLRSLGLQSTGVAGEQGAAKWLMTQRDKIRNYRREYLQALYENDTRRADNINQNFQREYPELGPMQVKKSDINAMENRREISRLHRILRGLPSAYKPLFGQIINEAAIGTMAQDIEAGSLGSLPQYIQ